jgi:PAS domain S-box-containing protein
MLRLLLLAMTGTAVFIAALLLTNIPDRIITGDRAQIAIQQLDSMRPPMLAIEKLDSVSPTQANTDAFMQASNKLKNHIADYLEIARYNDVLQQRVSQFSQTTNRWLKEENTLWQYRATLQATGASHDELEKLKQQHEIAITEFINALETLALGEHPIHHDIDLGRKANNTLLIFIALLALYLLLLVIVFQHLTRKTLLASFHDVEEAHREVAQREEYLSLTLDSIGDAVIATDAAGNITRMNPVAINLTGWSLHDALGQSLKTVFPIIDASTREPIENPVEKVIASGQTIYLSNHTTLIAKNGSEYQIADSAAPIRDAKNNITGMVLVFNDVTEQYQLRESRLETEQRLTDAQHLAQIGNWELNLVNDQLYWSGEIYRIFEIDPGKFDASYEAFLNAIHPDDRERVNATYTASVENKIPYNIEHRLRMADGRIKHIHERCETFYDDKGKPVRSSGTVQDITERVNMADALRRSQKMEAIGQLSGGIAHDFNNQLGVVIGYLDFLKEVFPQGDKQRRWVETATKATLRCTDLTRQLLTFSRHKARTTTAVDLNAAIHDMQILIARSVTPEIEVQYSLSDDLGLSETDPDEFQDAILNLTINARDAMPGGGKLIIETSNTYLDANYATQNPDVEAGDYLQLTISDTGTGMDRETMERIFEPFFTTKPKDKGTGLGMAMVYAFSKRYGGHIKLYSEPDAGTTLHLFLPRSKSSASDIITEKVHEAELPTGTESILIVDDEKDLLQLTQQILEQSGYHTQVAENAAQALDILKADNKIDLLFSDVIMPGGISGYELAKQATEIKPELKVLLTSGFTSKSNGLRKFSANMLNKPYRKSDLAQRIRMILDT